MFKCKDIFFKKIKNWVMTGLKIKMSMHIIGFWVFVILHECVHRWGKHRTPSPIKYTNVSLDGIIFKKMV
jgi:hypothetical protein